MAWEKRRNRWFYYRSYRDRTTGQVRKQYLGSGPAAEEAARQDAAQRAEKAAQRARSWTPSGVMKRRRACCLR